MADHGAEGSEQSTRSLRAIAHPVRLQMLSLLTGAEMSAAEVARELGLTHANASYHLRLLQDAGLLEVAGEERIRGGVAKRYRHRWDQHTRRGRTSDEDREVYARAIAEEMVRRMRLTDPDRPGHSTDAELWVTPEDFEAVRDALGEASSILHGRARPPRTEGTIRVGLTTALFQMRAEAEEEEHR
ncbi:ArsR/SmtB family transcription factor [Nocardioides sp. GXQ0305]|uniref:ArsR/SmtB family transcription factor n=1 Tax=Nocardioides sp. GXQ0305 TaxID=3423912 RepID=UPI003D7E5425